MPGLHTILVPTDFGAASAAALRYACDLADTAGASIRLLHTVERPPAIGGYGELTLLPDDTPALEAEARQTLEGLLSPEQRQKYHATPLVRQGVPATEILAYLRENRDVDLVVMGTHGRGGVTRLMLGSVADRVLRAAPCPVLTIRQVPAEAHRAA